MLIADIHLRIQHMLKWSLTALDSHYNRFWILKCLDHIRKNSTFWPITTAYYISCSSSSYRYKMSRIFLRIKKLLR